MATGTHIARLLTACALASLPTHVAAQSIEFEPLGISSWHMCDNAAAALCGAGSEPTDSDNERRVKAKHVLRSIFEGMVEAQVTLNFGDRTVKLLDIPADESHYRVRLGLAYQGAQIGVKTSNASGVSLSLRQSPSDLEDSEVYSHLRFELTW